MFNLKEAKQKFENYTLKTLNGKILISKIENIKNPLELENIRNTNHACCTYWKKKHLW